MNVLVYLIPISLLLGGVGYFWISTLSSVGAIAAAHDLAIVVTHGGLMRILLEHALGGDKQFMISNASLYRFYVSADLIRRIG